MPGTPVGPGNTSVNETDKITYPHKTYILDGMIRKISKYTARQMINNKEKK